MHRFHPPHIAADTPEFTELSFRDPAGWLDLPYPMSSGGFISLLLMGDDTDGPFAVLASTTPTEMDAPTGPAHGHESDSWRISLIGSSPMGPENYGPGQYRWQRGGQPYGADGYASGPDGGYHMVMFGDRRGFATQPVKRELTERYQQQDTGIAALLGIDVPAEYPLEARGVVTTQAEPDKAGKVNGSFDDAGQWDEVAAGVRVSAGLMGHHRVGPMLVMVRASAGATVQAPLQLSTDLLVMVVAGSCAIGDRQYQQGDLRLQRPGTALPEVIAGTDGADVCLIIADRSSLQGCDDARLSDLLAGLAAQVA